MKKRKIVSASGFIIELQKNSKVLHTRIFYSDQYSDNITREVVKAPRWDALF